MAKHPITRAEMSREIKFHVSRSGEAHISMLFSQYSDINEGGVFFDYIYESKLGTLPERLFCEKDDENLTEFMKNPEERGRGLLSQILKNDDLKLTLSNIKAGSADIAIYGEINPNVKDGINSGTEYPAANEPQITDEVPVENTGKSPREIAMERMREKGHLDL